MMSEGHFALHSNEDKGKAKSDAWAVTRKPSLVLTVRFKFYLSNLGVNKKLHGCVEASPHLSFRF